VPERAYLSIGEVLALLKDEFADITISKIRFLESQGLIDPERTPSGYRKFYEPDVERLRWILRQQKEHYLPLRVIKGKLSEAPAGDDGTGADDSDDSDEADEAVEAVEAGEAVEVDEAGDHRPAVPPALAAVPDPPDDRAEANGTRPAQPHSRKPVPHGPSERRIDDGRSHDRDQGEGRRAAPPFPESLRRSARTSPAAFLTAPDAPRRPQAVTPSPRAPDHRSRDEDFEVDEEIELTSDELAAAAGLPPASVGELERYGLVKGQPGPGGRYYDAAALEVAKLAAAFAAFGVEARHLKMWKTAADREADFYEQVITPIRSQRSTKARRQAGDTVTELAELGARLHAALVAGALKRLT
jgi:DNA-binding transcriptional MerR regulator